ALNCGVGADAVSALVAKKLFVRFFQGFDDCCLPLNADPGKDFNVISFPGGNDTVARHFLKAIRPELISGENTADGIFNGKLNFADFDKPGMRARIRSRSTAVDIRHDGDPSQANTVSITYYQEGKLHRVRAKTVVSAVGAWVNKKIIKDMDEQHRWAFSQPHHGSNLVANVALTNWRPMAKLGITACHYFTDQGLGIYCNIRKPMLVGNYAPPLDPDKPVVLTFYMGFPSSGSAQEQAVRSRTKLLHTGFSTFEFEIRRLLTEMFSDYGFDAKRDVAGIVLNRWGHSYIVPEPGFYFGRDGMPPVSHIMGQAHGRIAFAHSEQAGIQDWHNAAIFGEKAAEHALKIYR
ncbi:MAG: NAD(P)/FAD-dependent oxidoreductase, partial [Gammaproteobacteria bacterium]